MLQNRRDDGLAYTGCCHNRLEKCQFDEVVPEGATCAIEACLQEDVRARLDRDYEVHTRVLSPHEHAASTSGPSIASSSAMSP